MAVPREVIPIPKLRGLHDYPEQAPLGSASQAYNVDLFEGGVAPRNGMYELHTTQSEPGAGDHIVRGFWNHVDAHGQENFIVAWVSSNTKYGYIYVYDSNWSLTGAFGLSQYFKISTGGIYDNGPNWVCADLWNGLEKHPDSYDVNAGHGHASNANVGALYDTNPNITWGGTSFNPGGVDPIIGQNWFVITTDAPRYADGAPAGSPVMAWGLAPKPVDGFDKGDSQLYWQCIALGIIDRDKSSTVETFNLPINEFDANNPNDDGSRTVGNGARWSYWGGYVDSEISMDDGGTYLTSPETDFLRNDEQENVNGDIGHDRFDDPIANPSYKLELMAPAGYSPLIGGSTAETYKGRLVLGGLPAASERNSIRFSNFGDMQLGPGFTDFMEGQTSEAVVVPSKSYVVPNGNVLIDADLRRVPWSSAPWDLVTGFPDENVINFTSNVADKVMAVVSWKDMLVVFRQHSIHFCRFTEIFDFVEFRVINNLGLVSPNAYKSVSFNGEDVLFFVSHGGIYAWNGQLNYISGPIEKTVRATLAAGSEFNVIVGHRPRRNQLLFQIPSTYNVSGESSTEGQAVPSSVQSKQDAATKTESHMLGFDYANNGWTIYDYGVRFDAFINTKDRRSDRAQLNCVGVATAMKSEWGNTNRMIFVDLDAKTSAQDGVLGHDTDVVNVKFSYCTQRIAFGRHQVRRWSHLRLSHGEIDRENKTYKVFWLFDNQDKAAGTDAVQYANLNRQAAAAGVFGSGTFGNVKFESKGFFSSRTAIKGGPARWFRFGIESGEDTPARFFVVNAELDTRRKEGRR